MSMSSSVPASIDTPSMSSTSSNKRVRTDEDTCSSSLSSSSPPDSSCSYVLYSYFRSSCSWRVRQVLNYKNIPYTMKYVHLVKGEQSQPQYTDITSIGLLPTLTIIPSPSSSSSSSASTSPVSISQSLAIIDYLDSVHPSPPLLPSSPLLRAQCLQLVHLIASDTQPVTNLRILKDVERMGGNEEKQQWIEKYNTKGLKAFEKQLEATAGKYCVGDEISLADIVLGPQLYNARRFNVKLDKEQFPRINAIEERLKEMEWWKAAHPDNQQDNDVKPKP